MDLFQFINNNIVSLGTFILGSLVTIIIFLVGKKEKKPTYIIRTINLLRDNIKKVDNVKMFYAEKEITNLSISKIAIWNAGKDTINSTDIAPTSPIKVVINNEYDILDAEIIYQKKTANNFRIETSTNKKTVNITFDYFDFEDGVVLQLYHTGNHSGNITIDGTIKSVKSIICKNKASKVYKSFFSILHKIEKVINSFVIMLLLAAISFFSVIYIFINSVNFDSILVLLICLVLLVGIITSYMSIIYYRRIVLPKDFDIFKDEF